MKYLDAKRSRKPIENKMGPGPSADKANPPTSERASAGSALPTSSATGTGEGLKGPNATPAAIRIAEEWGIDLATVQGTGVDGRITTDDVRAVWDARNQGHKEP